MKYFSMFSGVGGFEIGIQQAYEDLQKLRDKNKNLRKSTAKIRSSEGQPKQRDRQCLEGLSCVGFSEIDKYAIKIYEHHFPTHKNWGDATRIIPEQLPDFDLLVGGFPCQSFSIAGKRRGFADTRGTLFFDIARILSVKKPANFVLENVKGLLSSRTTLTFERMLDILNTELSINIWQNQFQFSEWEVTKDNLIVYLQSIGKINGLQKNLKSLLDKILPIIKKQSYYPVGQMLPLGLKESEWVSSLLRLYSIDNLNTLDIHLLEKMVATNAAIVLSLKKCSEEKLLTKKSSITLTEINLTTDQKIYMSALQELNITLFIIKQWILSTNLWKKIESSSKKENTYYVKTFNVIISELTSLGYDIEWQVLNSKNFGVPQNRERVFIVGHLGGQPRRKVFPIGETISNHIEVIGELNDETWGKRNESIRRVYGINGLSPTIPTGTGGGVMPKIAPTIRTACKQTSYHKPSWEIIPDGMRIRRLTPTECERLQGFSDGFTESGVDTNYHIAYNKDSNNNLSICKKSTISKLNKQKNVKWSIVTENKLPTSVIALCTINGGKETEQLNCQKENFNDIQSVNIAIEKSEKLEQWECVINIIKCGDYTEMLSTWKINEADLVVMDISGQEMESQSIELLWKNILDESYCQVKYPTILMVAKQITESLIYTFAQELNMRLSISNLTTSSQNQLTGKILSLETENIIKISDSSRYKCCGNAVTTNVVKEVIKRLFT